MYKNFYGAIILLAVALTGCSTVYCGDSHAYAGSAANPPLHAPPGMSVPPPDPSYAIQGLDTKQGKSGEQKATAACLIKPPQLINAQSAANPKNSTKLEKVPEKQSTSSGKLPVKSENKNTVSAPPPNTFQFPAIAIALAKT